nr:hypothetical protein [Pedobacter sp. ASV2]
MMSNKLKAFTLMEVTVAMLLSAICITICFTAYGLIQNYYSNFRIKNETSAQLTDLKLVMDKDFLKSRYVIKTDEGLKLKNDSTELSYVFDEHKILRIIPGLHTDTFFVELKDKEFYFEGKSAGVADTVDFLNLGIKLKGSSTALNLQISKNYSAVDLFK